MKLARLKPLRIGGKFINSIHLQHFDIDQDMVCCTRYSSAEVGSGILDSTVSNYQFEVLTQLVVFSSSYHKRWAVRAASTSAMW